MYKNCHWIGLRSKKTGCQFPENRGLAAGKSYRGLLIYALHIYCVEAFFAPLHFILHFVVLLNLVNQARRMDKNVLT